MSAARQSTLEKLEEGARLLAEAAHELREETVPDEAKKRPSAKRLRPKVSDIDRAKGRRALRRLGIVD